MLRTLPAPVLLTCLCPAGTVSSDAGVGGGGGVLLELSLWGSHDPATGALDMVLGLPTGMLQQLGIADLPQGYLLPVQLRGTVDRPRVGYEAALRRLGALVVRQQYLAAQRRQRELREHLRADQAQTSQRGGGGLLRRALDVVSELQLPELQGTQHLDEQLARDMASVPQRWPLPQHPPC